MKKGRHIKKTKNGFQVYSIYNTEIQSHKTIAIFEVKNCCAEAESLTGHTCEKNQKKHLLLYIN